MKHFKLISLSACALITAATFPSAAYAESGLEFSANVSVVSKYLFRGYNLNDTPSVQGGFDLGAGVFYAGVWGASDEELGTEIDVYAGAVFDLSDSVSIDIGVIQYRYDESDIDEQIEEFYVGADFSIANVMAYFGEDDYRYFEVAIYSD